MAPQLASRAQPFWRSLSPARYKSRDASFQAAHCPVDPPPSLLDLQIWRLRLTCNACWFTQHGRSSFILVPTSLRSAGRRATWLRCLGSQAWRSMVMQCFRAPLCIVYF
ncbi:hypothetical protein COCVIDRAFT_93117 [Bipolaris victoriae FI3]|uniref:Uncharacterized protein n=1 Tax=Bipolaris victoriae (strain FI3) TaxID=930091 RepID=W7EZ65_BIPV3|nr:hypothetical protein COCVIDRAFT_93117 [Bipolaris victoriae FI3]